MVGNVYSRGVAFEQVVIPAIHGMAGSYSATDLFKTTPAARMDVRVAFGMITNRDRGGVSHIALVVGAVNHSTFADRNHIHFFPPFY